MKEISIVSPDDGLVQAVGVAEYVAGGVIVGGAFFPVPPFLALEQLPPSGVPGAYRWEGGQWHSTAVAPEPVDLAAFRLQLADTIDARIAEIYSRWLRFEAEYVEREAAARQFVAAEYQGDAGEWVTSFAGPAGLSAEAAADRIVSQADGLRAALRMLAALRMAKYIVLAAEDVTSAQAECDAIIAQANAVAEAL